MTKTTSIKSITEKVLFIFLMFSIPFCCSAGISVVPHFFRVPLIVINSLICLLLIVFSNIKINVTLPSVLFIMAVAFLFISGIFSYTPDATLKYALIYLAISVLLFMDFSEDFFEKVLKIINVISLVVAVSIIICPIFGEIAKAVIGFVTNPLNNSDNTKLIAEQFQNFTYGGFAKEVSEAAFIMNIGIATIIARLFSNFKVSIPIIAELVIFIIALALTGKRTLFVVPIIAVIILLLVTKARKKAIILTVGFFVIVAGTALIAGIFFAPFGNLFEKFLSSFFTFESDNRLMLSDFAFRLFLFAPVFGTGFYSFNQLLFDSGMTYNNGMWQNNTHNIYLQSLGENGIVGTVVLFSMFIVCAVLCVVNLRKNACSLVQKGLLLFALYIHILCFIYGITGNVIFVYSQVYTWIISCAISICVSVHLTKRNCKKVAFCKRLISN